MVHVTVVLVSPVLKWPQLLALKTFLYPYSRFYNFFIIFITKTYKLCFNSQLRKKTRGHVDNH